MLAEAVENYFRDSDGKDRFVVTPHSATMNRVRRVVVSIVA